VLTDLAKATADAKDDSAGPRPKKPQGLDVATKLSSDGGE
jgi:hypothetical protein